MQSKLLSFNDNELTQHVKKARLDKGLQYVGFVAVPCVAFAMLASLLQEDGVVSGALGVGAVCVASSFYFKFDRNRHNAAAVKRYNEEFR